MCSVKRGLLCCSFIFAVHLCFFLSVVQGGDVCSSGTGLPPFLDEGVDPNLLLVLDNSGSMLDMAYQDKEKYTGVINDTGEEYEYQKTCSDDGYLKEQDEQDKDKWVVNVDKEYAGYFEKDTWYQWQGHPVWMDNSPYGTGSIVSSEGKLYIATCIPSGDATTCTSDGTSLENETGTGLVWEEISPATVAEWKNTGSYSPGSIVAYQGMIFKAKISVGPSSAKSLFDNRDGLYLAWERIDEGFFHPTSAEPCADPTYIYSVDDGTNSGRPELQVSFDNADTPTAVTCFAARGNILNWATASKLDIQKKILTGGKFYSGNEKWDASGKVDNAVTSDMDDDRLVSEHRGCSGKGFVKEIPLNQKGDGSAVNCKTLVLKVRGPVDGIDRLDPTDFTTRIEIVGVNTDVEINGICGTGGVDYESCAEYLELLKLDAVHSKLREPLERCLYGSKPVQPVFNIYHSALHDCWKISKGAEPPHAENLQSQCEAVYNGTSHEDTLYPQQYPWMISPWDAHYICSGLWDKDKPPIAPEYNGQGYVGRCWQDWPVSSTGVECINKICEVEADGDWVSKNSGYYKNINNVGQFCSDDGALQYECEDGGSVDITKNNPSCSQPGEKFTPIIVQSDDNETRCEGGTTAYPVCLTEDCWGADTWGPQEEKACVEQAEWDYCRDLNVPNVIDPSDLPATSDGAVWGIVAAIIDASIYGQMGVEKPLMVMKGYIKYELPDEQISDKLERSDGPRGILFDSADDLRIGAMAFRDNGSKTECDKFKETCDLTDDGKFAACSNSSTSDDCKFCLARQSIGKYCETMPNYDGAEVITQIREGMYVDDNETLDNYDDDKEVWDHYNLLVTKINAIKATSWTPLAEAMYTALSYYGQNKISRLNSTDYYMGTDKDPDGNLWPDPVEGEWCRDNHVLIITEGASTTDINPTVTEFAETVADDDTNNTGDSKCGGGLEGSTYFDDLTWFGQHAKVTDNDSATNSTLYSRLEETSKVDPKYQKKPITTHIVTSGSLSNEDPDSECSPKILMENAAINGKTEDMQPGENLYQGEDPDQLEANLRAALSAILSRASAGSAASVISSSRSGEGAVYQAVFWPKVDRDDTSQPPLTWTGDVHALFIDDQGRMWDDNNHDNTLSSSTNEDDNGNGILDAGEDDDPDGPEVPNGCLDGDRRVFFYYDGQNSRICFNDSVLSNGLQVCDTSLTDYCDKTGEGVLIKEFGNFLWSANDELRKIEDLQLRTNRNVVEADDDYSRWVPWSENPSRRYVFTWNDLNNDGIVNDHLNSSNNLADEVIPLDDSVDWDTKPSSIPKDFNIVVDEWPHFIDWLRGLDWYEEPFEENVDPAQDINNNGIRDDVYRCRRADCRQESAIDNREWRLGDIIHSTPKLVAQPAESFHTIYRDASYSRFVKKHRYRRNMIYFGANDGMLHAVNGGFFDETENKFCTKLELVNGKPTVCNNEDGPSLGTEMWAYVPYNLQPHLKCLTDPKYAHGKHKYFVDKEPRVFDMQIFTEESACSNPYSEDCIHPGGWGTILVGALRFGGAPTLASDGNRQFISSYFILDITDPERPPRLLGELTRTTDKIDTAAGTEDKYAHLGYSTPMPSGVVMRDDDGTTDWYLVFGNGPTSLKGENDQPGKVAVLPMKLGTTGVLNTEFRFLNEPPDSDTPGVITFKLENGSLDATTRFISDMMTVDFDVESKSTPGLGSLYKSDAVYFGTVDGTGFTTDDDDVKRWGGGGGVYRLVTRAKETQNTGEEIPTSPDEWYISKLMDTGAPVTGGLSVGWDLANFWIYFGSGRFFATEDKKDDTAHHFFGVKEPLDENCEMSWGEIDRDKLVRTDNIQVVESKDFMLGDEPVVFCPSVPLLGITDPYCDLSFLGSPLPMEPSDGKSYYAFEALREYIAGASRSFVSSVETCNQTDPVAGWYRRLQDPGERVTGQSALLGGLVTYTTYQPSDDLCTAEGMSNLYGVHYQTGTAWYENVFGTKTVEDRKVVLDRLSLGVGLATTPSMHSGSDAEDAKAFIQSSTGQIIEIGQENLPIQPPTSGRVSWCDDCE